MSKAEERPKNKRLGRGLAALIGDVSVAESLGARHTPGRPQASHEEQDISNSGDSVKSIPIEFVSANPRNPRKTFSEDELADLAASVKEKGIVQPILVRPVPGSAEKFEIIAGERRWRAAQRSGLHEVPVVVREVTDQEALELAIIENVQRSDLNSIEEAMGYDQLISEFSYSQNELAKIIGKSRSHVANTLRLLKLPNSVKDYLAEGLLTAGHARALITVEDPAALAEIIVEKGLTVREAEKLAQNPDAVNKPAAGLQSKPEKDADTKALEKRLTDGLGLKIAIQHKNDGKGEMRIRYASLEQLDNICKILGYPN
ncbi:MAG: ParB/RepB/Spo0J family partition protein [Stappiaceae bacterium]